MDYKRIFLKGATPTSIGGQAIMEGVMMRGENRTALAVRVPDGRIYLKTEKTLPKKKIMKRAERIIKIISCIIVCLLY